MNLIKQLLTYCCALVAFVMMASLLIGLFPLSLLVAAYSWKDWVAFQCAAWKNVFSILRWGE